MHSAGLVRIFFRSPKLGGVVWRCFDPSAETCGCWRCWVTVSEAAATRRWRARGASAATAARGAALFMAAFFVFVLAISPLNSPHFGDIQKIWRSECEREEAKRQNPRGYLLFAYFGDWRIFSFPSPGCRRSPPRPGVGLRPLWWRRRLSFGKTRFSERVKISQGREVFFGKPAEKRVGLRIIRANRAAFFPFLCGKGRRQAQ